MTKGVFYFLTALIFLHACPPSDAMDVDNTDKKESTMKPRILIVGGGIGGLTFANTLHRHSIPFDLVEKKTSWEHEGAGIALPANAVWVLEQLDFNNEIEGKAKLIEAMSFTTDQDELLIKEDITKIHKDGAQFRSIHRADLQTMLFEKIKDSKIAMGVSVKTICQKPGGAEVDVEFSDNTQKTYDLVVGADGVHSIVRQQIFGKDDLTYQGIAMWRTVVNTPEGLDHPIYMLGKDTLLLLYPINNNQTYIYSHHIDPICPKDIEENRISKLKTLFSNYKGYVSQALDQLKDPKKVIPGWLETFSEIKWSKGNVVLIGDASHVCSPALQQGGAQAIEDGWVLGEELNTGLLRGDNIAKILSNFVQRRDSRVQQIVQESDKKIKILPEIRNKLIQEKGAPNVASFRVIMKENP